MPQIGYVIREAVRARLADPIYGYAACLAAAAPGYPGIDLSVLNITDFGPNSKNYIGGDIDPDIFDAQSDFYAYPFLSLDTNNTRNTNDPLNLKFGGTSVVVLRLRIRWNTQRPLPDFAAYLELAEDALIQSINNQDPPMYQPLDQDTGQTGYWYSGQMSTIRTVIVHGGQSFLQQMLACSIPFRLQSAT